MRFSLNMLHALLISLVLLSTSTAQSQMPRERYLVLQLTRLGLANRLRTVADMHRIAMLSKRKLLLSWKPTPDCNCSFFDLFEKGPAGLEVLPLVLEDGDMGVKAVREMAAENGLSYQFVSIDILNKQEEDAAAAEGRKKPDEIDFFWPFATFDSNIDVVHTTYDGVLSTHGVRCQDHMAMHSRLLRGLVPISSVREMVEEIESQYFNDRLPVGIHIRTHDKAHDWEVVPPGPGQNMARAFGEGASAGDFESNMALMAQYFGRDRVRFFIASNDPDTKRYLQGKFEGSIALFGEDSRSSTGGMQFALMELLVLARTSLILHTFGSTFAMEAAQFNLIPVVGIFSGSLIRHNDISLRFCGNIHYMKHFSQNAVETSYVEGTFDRRTIRAKSVALNTCPEQLNDWGLPSAVCYS